MKILNLFSLMLFFSWLTTACVTEPEPKPQPDTSQQKGYVTGRATDTKGNPIVNAAIVVNNTQFFNSNILGSTNAEGYYKIKLNPGSWYVRGTVSVPYDNQIFIIDLHPETEGAFAGTEGAVRNLQWKLAGPKPTEFGGGGYYGGLVEIYGDMTGGFFNTEAIELTLEPVGPLVDGSAGQIIKRQLTGGVIGQTEDVPLGRYRIAARYLPTNQVLLIRERNKNQAYKNTITNGFEPAYTSASGSYKITLEARLP
ncbi:MAG: carboxypeptidase-like regulatory domain-containing protein [Adhaeribacter sp.]